MRGVVFQKIQDSPKAGWGAATAMRRGAISPGKVPLLLMPRPTTRAGKVHPESANGFHWNDPYYGSHPGLLDLLIEIGRDVVMHLEHGGLDLVFRGLAVHRVNDIEP